MNALHDIPTHRSRSRRLTLGYAAGVTRAFRAAPHEAVERTLEKVAEWRDERGAPHRYPVTDALEERVHEMLGAPWPCPEVTRFAGVWETAVRELQSRSLAVGRGAFGGWDDGDPRFVRLVWCVACHLRPQLAVETGVARGLTTRAILEAFKLNGAGQLWSIDLPPLVEQGLASEQAIAVPEDLRRRWTLVHGSSRRTLPGLISELGQIDLFVHDSMHTTRNLRFELEQVWPALAPGGVAVIDDVEKNAATGEFLRAHPDATGVICASQDAEVLIGVLVKRKRR